MNIFRNTKITHQFLMVFGVLVIGFIAVGLAYMQVLNVERASAMRIQQTNEFGNLVNLLKADIMEMTVEEAGFLLTRDIQYVEKFEDIIARAEQKIGRLAEEISEQQVLDQVAKLQEDLSSFDDTFHSLVNTQVQLGLNENTGRLGEMRAAEYAIEETLNELGNDKLLASMLRMRSHEKDFILRGEREDVQRMAEEQKIFADLLSKTSIRKAVKNAIAAEMATYTSAFNAFVNGSEQVENRHNDLNTALQDVLQPSLDSLLAQKDALIAANHDSVAAERGQITVFFITAIIVSGAVVAAALLFVAFRMRRSVSKLHDTVQKVAAGDFTVHSDLATDDELGVLGNAFHDLLEERAATISEVEKEKDALNESIITLMTSVAKLSQKDLTVKAVVAEDVTGPVSDAVNLMTSETTNVLNQIREVSQQVERTANTVRGQAEKVTKMATEERKQVQETAKALQQSGVTMNQLAKGAKGADEKAAVAIKHTRDALEAVSTTIEGIEKIRDIIRETEKRIKRLGERSLEINGAVNLINTIAERTHILALNASMHAASAGEAGRGFAVVADEVQRLAESSREATSDISSMVNAIQVETADTVHTMNQVIDQVVEGTRLAEEAGKRMHETESTTTDLVSAVRTIATRALKQAHEAVELVKRSHIIVKSTEQTSGELKTQAEYTVSLVDYSNSLRESIGVFKLPKSA